ncbi:hypothetical protein [Actinomadura yumaensis]|uniref:Uncharacterized protein n=1 Tax=Actinomadura yumaensis TaxID=111807 RepID=A0ABW2CNZ8_9ACTN
MSKNLSSLAVLAAIGAVVLYFVADVPLSTLLSLGAGALCLIWLVVLLTVPWNVYFQARGLLQEIHDSRDRGLTVTEEREAEACRIAGRSRTAAVGAHLLSAALIAVIAYFSGAVVGYYFVAFYLVSTFFRPVHAWFVHLRRRLGTLLQEVRHPRDDVLALLERVTFLEAQAENLRSTTEQLHEADLRLDHRLEIIDTTTSNRSDELNGKINALGRRFEDTVARLTDNQEVITGIKAFLRLLKTDPA